MQSVIHKKKSIFYLLTILFSLSILLCGSLFFKPQTKIAYADELEEQQNYVEQQQNYVEHSSDAVGSMDPKFAYFYVSAFSSKNNDDQILIGNNKTYFVKQNEIVTISFARKSELIEANNAVSIVDQKQKLLPEVDGKKLDTTARTNFVNVRVTRDGEALQDFSAIMQDQDHQYYYKEIAYEQLVEGLYNIEITYNLDDKIGNVTHKSINYSIFLLKNSTYNLENGTPNVEYLSGMNSVYVNSDFVAYERFYNYQHTGSAENGGFGLATLKYNINHFQVDISKSYEGKNFAYSFKVENGKLVCTKSSSAAPELTYSSIGQIGTIVLKDVGTYSISYSYIYAVEDQVYKLDTQNTVRRDIVHVFGYQAFYSDYERDLTELRGEKNVKTTADVTYLGLNVGTDGDNEGKLIDKSNKTVNLNALNIVSTNQAPVRMKFSAALKDMTYYVYDAEKGLWAKQEDQRTIFTNQGLYFAEFVYTFDDYKYASSDNVVSGPQVEHTQKFLFEITTSTPIVEITNSQTGNLIYSDTFTKENVEIMVAPRTEFDSSILVEIDMANFNNLGDFSTKVDLANNYALLNQSGKYRVRTSYGKGFNKTNTTYFTIDKDPISGLGASTIIMADYTDIYVKDKNIDGLFSNMPFALAWNEKRSGALIKCDYQLIPLEQINTNVISPSHFTDSEIWVSGGGNLKWTQTQNLVPYTNTEGKTSVWGAEILNEPGLYLFNLKDEAGWEQAYYVLLDNTQTKFLQKRLKNETEYEYFEPSALNNVANDTIVEWGTHKLISISGVDATNIASDNVGRLKGFFEKYLDENRTYVDYVGSNIVFKNKIEKVFLKTDIDGVSALNGSEYEVKVLKNGLPNEQIYYFYTIDSANKKVLTNDPFSENDTSVYSGSHFIKVSTDMTKAMLLPSKNVVVGADGKIQITELAQFGAAVIMPSNLEDLVDVATKDLMEYLKLKNLKNYYYTNQDTLYFSLIKEVDANIKVSEVQCDYYALVYDQNTKTYSYSQTATPITLTFETWNAYNDVLSSEGDSSIFSIAAINVDESEMTKPGKYIIKRTYDIDESDPEALNKLANQYDYLTREFVFFVDRNPILTGPTVTLEDGTTAKEVGEYLRMFVLAGDEKQVLFDALYRQPQVQDKNDINSIESILSTNKLPVKIYIPYAKYGYENGEKQFTTSDLYANITTSYLEGVANSMLHPNLKLRAIVTYIAQGSGTISKKEYNISNENGYLGVLDITQMAGQVVGDYFVDIYDGMGNSWMFKFTVIGEAPQMDFVAMQNDGQTKTNILDKQMYTNGDALRVEWTDSLSEYMAKIDKGSETQSAIYYTINGQKYDVAYQSILTEGQTNYFVISTKKVEGADVALEHGDVISVYAHFEGLASDYPEGAYYFTRTIEIDYQAPTQNLYNLADSVLLTNAQDVAATREACKKYNRTLRTSDAAFITYAIGTDFAFNKADHTNETMTIYYRPFYDKYSKEVKETNVPTDPNAGGANVFNPMFLGEWRRLTTSTLPVGLTSGIYEIIEVDSAGNYTIYSVYLYKAKEELSVNYNTQTQNSVVTTFDEGDWEIGVFNTFVLNSIEINGDDWFNIYISKAGEAKSSAFRHTPALADGEVYIGATSSKAQLKDAFKFENNTRYIIEITSRQAKALKTLVVNITTMSRRFDVNFIGTDTGAEIEITKDDILEINSIEVAQGTLIEGSYGYEILEPTISENASGTKVVVNYDTTKLLRLSILTNFGTTQNFFYIYGQQQIEEEITGVDVADTDPNFDYVASNDVTFTYNKYLYSVVVGYKDISYVGEYVEHSEEGSSLNSITLLSSPFTYKQGVWVGEDRVFTLTIHSLINLSGGEQESDRVLNIRINNVLPKINLYNDYGEDQNVLFSGGITKQGVVIRFEEDTDFDFVVTLSKRGSADKQIIKSGHTVSDFGSYELTCSLRGLFTASYTKYFTITQQDLAVYAVIAKDSEDAENYIFLDPSKNYYKMGEQSLPYYITNKPYVAVTTDSTLDIAVGFTTLSTKDGATTRLYTITNITAQNQNIYVNDKIVVTTIPQSNNILSNFIKIDSDGMDAKIQDLVSDKMIMTSSLPENEDGELPIEFVKGTEQVTLRWESYYLEQNNKILVTYSYEDQIIFERQECSSIVLSTTGKHTLVFEDMAGNRHIFSQNIQQSPSFDFYFIKSAVFKVNSENPIDYAVYNGEVTISIPDSSLQFYDAATSPKLVVKRAGELVEMPANVRSWTLSEPGFYEIYLTATWLRKNILAEPFHFSIINSTESRLAYEYNCVEKYEIVSVKKGEEEIISRFEKPTLKTITASLNDELTGEGRYTITVKAIRNDPNIPAQEFSFSFWLHQAAPPIVVSVEQGTETKDVITVQFNVHNLYEEVGDCYVVVGNLDPIVIEGSNLGELEALQTLSLEKAGDHYIQVFTKSGNLVYSYRVIKKDPLNTVTIILIVVGAVVLIMLIVIFVKLRKKVKIR